MTLFALEAAQAGKGDALIVRWGQGGDNHMMMIDGGPSTTWAQVLRPRLQYLAGSNPDETPREINIDVAVVSHVDDDHIGGIIELAQDIDISQQQALRLPAVIGEVWHNAFSDVAILSELDDTAELRQALIDASRDPDGLIAKRPASGGDAGAVVAQSVRQGRQLDALLRKIGVPRNSSFPNQVARSGNTVDMAGLACTVVAPSTTLLDKLKDKWTKELPAILRAEADRRTASLTALGAAFDDPSVPNQSSIVLIAEFEQRSILLTGDARGDHLIDALDDAGLPNPFHVDVFKVPHHGSAHTVGPDLFARVTADRYVVSGNGDHGNPHPDALIALFESAAGRDITVYFTNERPFGATDARERDLATRTRQVIDRYDARDDVTIVFRTETEPTVVVNLL